MSNYRVTKTSTRTARDGTKIHTATLKKQKKLPTYKLVDELIDAAIQHAMFGTFETSNVLRKSEEKLVKSIQRDRKTIQAQKNIIDDVKRAYTNTRQPSSPEKIIPILSTLNPPDPPERDTPLGG